MLLVGIDEAGYGPVLGPLVISAVGFRIPSALGSMCLWELLSESVTNKPSRKTGKLVITDSKKLYADRSSLANLERSALAPVWSAADPRPETLTALLKAISLDPDPHLYHQWYCHADPSIPCEADRDDLRIAVKMFAGELRDLDAAVEFVRSIPMVEARFNHLYDRMRNKSALLLNETIRLIDSIIRTTKEREILIYLDRQSGRTRYTDTLLRCFGASGTIEVLEETDDHSGYSLSWGGKAIRLHFLVKGETRQLPIALASIVSKYLRELFMLQFNDYWVRLCPQIKPTAGYHQDGLRFITELVAALQEKRVPLRALLRHDQESHWHRGRTS